MSGYHSLPLSHSQTSLLLILTDPFGPLTFAAKLPLFSKSMDLIGQKSYQMWVMVFFHHLLCDFGCSYSLMSFRVLNVFVVWYNRFWTIACKCGKAFVLITLLLFLKGFRCHRVWVSVSFIVLYCDFWFSIIFHESFLFIRMSRLSTMTKISKMGQMT